ncbi:hypothetical protein [Sinorhizobium meliloti]|uniref:hypothetical protein n=1 Tax=Rhizobium meliloti TaxID=382 RepID=UPI000FD6EA13|nr:hypothetical protein [Sinorhizobium meliloti]RVQ55875.1 hypothetical protein CN245_16095 [Sinorhizobium meliloti]
MNKLAVELGLSDQGLAKACRRYDIPVPPLGYWQKLAHGKAIDRPPLESVRFDENVIVQVPPGVKMRPKPIKPEITKASRSASEPEAEPKAEKAEKPHPMLIKIRKAFDRSKKPSEFAYVNVSPFKIRASPLEAERVLSLISSVVAAAPFESWEFKPSKDGDWELLASGERVEISLTENTKNVPHVATPTEIRESKLYSWIKIPEFDQVPSGELKFTITNASYLGVRSNWSDGKKQTLESVLPSFIEGVSLAGAALHARRLEREEQARKAEIWQRQEAERRRLQEIQRMRVAILKEQARQHSEAEALRAYVTAVKAKLGKEPPDDLEPIQTWINWAEQYIQELDPLYKGLPALMSDEEAYRNSWRYRDE